MSVKILLIEDNPDHILLAKRILKNASDKYQIDAIEQAEQGIEKIKNADYNMIISDYNLAGVSALDVLREIRAKGKDIPFVVVTSAGSEKIAAALMREGASDYVVKDDTYRHTLPMVVERTLARYNAIKDKERLTYALQESNQKLKQMYQIKSDFTSMVSHELRTPLTAIREGISIVLDGSTGAINDDQKEFLAMAKKNVDRLARLINDVLDFSKLEAKKLEFKMEEGNINELVEEITKIQNKIAKDKGIYLEAETSSNIPIVKFDSDRVIQVLTNLVNNAIKFTNTGGVKVITAVNQNEIFVTVKDTGEGIKKEDMPKLFQKFQQLGDVNQRKTGGTGLGLAICKQIITQHGGRLWAESEQGKGSKFIFTLPIRKFPKILLIDDERQLLDICGMNLQVAGYNVLLSEQGKEGLELAQEEKPDLIILDMRLKDISGFELIGRLKSNKDTKDIPVLVMSGYKDEIMKIQENEELALPWILKPFKNDEILSKIQSLLPGPGVD